MTERVVVGTLDELRRTGRLTGKAGAVPICVFWSEQAAFALDDRCPHMGFPLHRGTVETGLVTCHWHHARFDVSSGGTLDPWADDVRAYPVEIDTGDVVVLLEPDPDRTGYLMHRLEEGIEQGITLVIAKAVLGLLDAGVPPSDIVKAGVDFGTRYRGPGWGAGLTVLTAMANVRPYLDPADQGLALVHGLAFVSLDTRGRPPRFPLAALGGEAPADRLAAWYRRFIETRSADAAERSLASAIATLDAAGVADIMLSAVTDHAFIDGGHTHRLHEQGIRSARSPWMGGGLRHTANPGLANRVSQPQRGARRLAIPARPRRHDRGGHDRVAATIGGGSPQSHLR